MLRHVDAKFRQVVVAHDMMHKERQECKELVDQAKEKKMIRSRETGCTKYGALRAR